MLLWLNGLFFVFGPGGNVTSKHNVIIPLLVSCSDGKNLLGNRAIPPSSVAAHVTIPHTLNPPNERFSASRSRPGWLAPVVVYRTNRFVAVLLPQRVYDHASGENERRIPLPRRWWGGLLCFGFIYPSQFWAFFTGLSFIPYGYR